MWFLQQGGTIMFDQLTSAPLADENERLKEPPAVAIPVCATDVLARNEQWVRQRLADDRDMAADYLRATSASPWLFRSFELPSIMGHVEGVVGHFKGDGLTREQYLSAVAAYPPLVLQKSAVVIENIEQVLRHYLGDGLSRSDYLQAALDQPILFRTNPQAVIDNIVDLEEWLAGPGTADCLRKAIDRPRLFAYGVDALPGNSSATISGAGEEADRRAVHVEESPTTQVSAPVIQELARALRGRSQAA